MLENLQVPLWSNISQQELTNLLQSTRIDCAFSPVVPFMVNYLVYVTVH